MSLEDSNILTPTHRFIFIAFENDVGCSVEFVQNVRPAKYRLFQLADLVCTLHLMELKIKNGIPLTCSENRFSAVHEIFSAIFSSASSAKRFNLLLALRADALDGPAPF